MIVKNEEAVLGRCLESVAGVFDEIIIVDTGSADQTVEIAKRFTDKVFYFEWVEDFAAARNEAFSKATGDYIMWLDADDIVEPAEREKMLQLKESQDGEVDMYYMKYNLLKDENGVVIWSTLRERLIRREAGLYWIEPIHEVIEAQGETETVNIAITHGEKERTHSDRNLRIHELQAKNGTQTQRGRFYYASELKTHFRFKESIQQYEAFLENGGTWREDNIQACIDLAYLHKMLGEKEKSVKYLLQTMLYDPPRAKACCLIGDYFYEKDDDVNCVYWYDMALHPNTHRKDGFFEPDYCDFYPHLQLCLVFDRLELHEGAYRHFLAAKALKPTHPSVVFNEAYFLENYPEVVEKFQ
ncbi:MAG: glycosyltransferase family 2 protein [Turicibacter sp.]|nr:glycosyltransferase family 2 protein [Turicibacter sp.]